MILKFQAPVPGEQPNITAGGLATMQMPIGPRIGVLYIEASVVKAAGGAGVYSVPAVTDIIHPTQLIYVKHDGRPFVSRLVSEILNIDNLLQDATATGSVSYYQDAGAGLAATQENLITRVANAQATAQPAGLAANKATLAVFQIPIYFAQYWRKDISTGEMFGLPTSFAGGLVSGPITVEVPVANNGGGAFSGWTVKLHYDYDGAAWPVAGDGSPRATVVKRERLTKLYAAAGDTSFAIPQKDLLMQFTVLIAAGDKWSKLLVRKNGTTLKDITPDRLYQSILDHQLNPAVLKNEIIPVVFDLNDDVNASLPLNANDTFEVTLTLTTVQAAAQAIVLIERAGLPD